MASITVLIGSPRRGGNTELLASAFCEGARTRHEVAVLSVSDLNIAPCSGCNACRAEKFEGICVQKDDMRRVFEALLRTDILVIASPVYFYGLSAQLKAVIDRLHTRSRKQLHIKKLGLLLAAADDAAQVFDPIKAQFALVLDYFSLQNIGEVCVGGVEEKGAILGNAALERARALGISAE